MQYGHISEEEEEESCRLTFDIITICNGWFKIVLLGWMIGLTKIGWGFACW